MTSENISTSFGHYLRTKRIEKGIRLETVLKETRIGMDNLLHIEQEDHERLPAEVFVKGFIKAYAAVVGADPRKALNLYMESLGDAREASTGTSGRTRFQSRFWLRIIASMVIFLCIIFFSIFALSGFKMPFSPAEKEALHIEEEKEQKQETAARQEEQAVAPVKKDPQKVSSSLRLRIDISEESWIKIIIDSQSPKKYNLKSGEWLEFEASSGFNLLISNAAGVKLHLNGKPVEVPGKSGQIVNVQIP